MKNALRTVGYFTVWGGIYGFLLSGWSGTMIAPVFGTVFGLMYGTLIGLIIGFFAGLLVSVIQVYTFHPDVNLDQYGRRLSLGVGLAAAIAAPLLLIAASKGILWTPTIPRHPLEGRPFLDSSLIAVSFWCGLSLAYIARAYPAWLAGLKTGQRRPYIVWPSLRWPVPRLTVALARQGMNWATLILGAMGGMMIELHKYELNDGYNGRSLLSPLADGFILGVIGTVILVLLLSFGNAALGVFLKRVFFTDETIVSLKRQSQVMTGISFVFTGIALYLMLLSQCAVFVPLCMILMALYVYEAFPLLDEDFDKAKRKEASVAVTA